MALVTPSKLRTWRCSRLIGTCKISSSLLQNYKHSNTFKAEGPHLQASTQTRAETPGPGPELSDTAGKEEEASSKMAPTVIEE